MAIQNIKANKTASLTDLREPRAIIESLKEGGEVAILDRNKVVAYMRGADDSQVARYDAGAVRELFAQRKPKVQGVLDYLKDK
jgi:hypothetical protein